MKLLLTSLSILALCSTLLFGQEINVTKEDRCAVRNFKLYKNPRWYSQIELVGGQKVLFSSPKSMFEYYYQPAKWSHYGAKSKDDFKAITLLDYYTMEEIDARTAYYVYGSNQISPGGDDLVPFKNEINAKNYAAKHNGKRILRLSGISLGLIKLLNGDM